MINKQQLFFIIVFLVWLKNHSLATSTNLMKVSILMWFNKLIKIH